MVGMRKTVGALVLFGMLTLAGCVDGNPIPTLPPTPSATPIFASEEEALAAAEEAYAAYLEMSALISSEGGVNPERIAPFVTESHLPAEIEAFAFYSSNSFRSVGSISFDSMTLQQADLSGPMVEISVYVCADVAGSQIVDGAGNDVTPTDRPDRIPLEVAFEANSDQELLLSESDQWTGSDFC